MQNNQKKTKLSLAGRLRILISAFLVFLFSGVIAANFISVGYSALSTTLLDGALGASSGDDKWTKKSESSISGNVEGTTSGGACSSDSPNSSTLTLTNNLKVSASLSFSYSITNNTGSVTIDGTTVTTDSTFGEKELAVGGSVAISITSGNGSGKVTSIEISNIQLVNKNAVSITFLTPTNGSYTVDGEEISESVTKNNNGNTTYSLVATPDSGYKFIQWEKVVDGKASILSKEQNSSITISESCSIRPVFVSENAAQFMNNESYFYDLQDAINSANSSSDKTIIVTGEGSVSAGTYTIASGCTLLVPFDEAGTLYRELSESNFTQTHVNCTLYRKLILEPNVILNIEGELAVESQLSAQGRSNGYNGTPSGPYGELELKSGSVVNLLSGAKLYAWGYITGGGVINAKNGSTVYEAFQIKNFRGGSATLKMVGNSQRVFPFNQYYVQNIECKMILEAGATEICYSAVTMKIITNDVYLCSIAFIGGSTSSALFKLNSGKLIKEVDTANNRLNVTIEGIAVISNITVKIATSSVKSQDYVLPIGHNMNITVANGGQISTNQDLAFLPNCSLIVNQGGEFIVSSGNSVYVYDSSEWASGYDFNAIYYPYCATTKNTKNSSTTYVDAVFDINGTVTVNSGGYFYTTVSGACLKSSQKTGVVNLNGSAATDSTTYQYASDYSAITVTSAKLQNGDGSYYETTGKSNCSIIYSSASHSWKDSSITTDTITLKFIDQNGNELMTSSFENPGSFTFPTKDSFGSFNVYFWQFSDGTLYSPGKTESLNLSPDDNGEYIFTGRSSGWVTNLGLNQSYYLSDDFRNDSNYPGCVKGLYSVIYKDSKQQKICYFNEKGLFQESFGGVFYYSSETYSRGDNCYYYLRNGVVVENAGLQRIADPIAGRTVKYYYFGNDNRAYTNGTYYISINLNRYLCPGTYEFNSDGSIVADVNVNPSSAITISDDGTYCHIDGVKVGYGLFLSNGHYYYALSDGTLVKDKTVYVSKNYSSISITGFTFPGLYYFDSNGYLCDSSLTPVEAS